MVKNKLKEILARNNIKQTELLKISGVTKATISNIVNNKYEPSISLAFKIANYLDIPFEEIFYEEEILNFVKESYAEYFIELKERVPYKVVSTMVFEKDITKEEIVKRVQSIKSLNAKILSIEKLN